MRTKFSGILTLLLAFVVQLTFAQEKTISGTITDENSLPLPGVNVIIKGTSNGTQSDFDGNYSITTAVGQTLVYSYLSYSTVERSVGAAGNISFSMEPDAAQLTEVIVTAQGIKRDVRAVGYSVSTVSSEKLESKPQADVARLLRGNAPGVNVVSSGGLSGSGTSVIIRGFSSIQGSNQALFVVDGVPIDTSVQTEGSFVNNANTSSRSLDLDPNQIANISVLKGLSATALYGEQGRNGVVLITTKGGAGDGSKKTSVTVNQSVFVNEIVLPDYQNTYGGGFYNDYGPFFSNWGAAFDSRETIPNAYQQFADLFPDRPELAEDEVAYRPYDSQQEFFKTGYITSTSLSASGGNEEANFNIGFGHLNDESFLPGNSFARTNFSVGGNAKLANKFRIGGKLTYSRSRKQSPMTDASLGSDVVAGGIASIWNILYNPRSVDTFNLPFQNPATNESIWYRGGNDRTNPMWALQHSRVEDETDRFFGYASMTYDFTDNISAGYNFGLDSYAFDYLYGISRGSNDGTFDDGYLKTTRRRNNIFNHNFTVNYNGAIVKSGDDKVVGLEAVVGAQGRRDTSKRTGLESRGQAENGFGLLNHGNFAQSTNFIGGLTNASANNPYDRETAINQLGIYGSFSFDFKNYLFLNVSARNDYTSTLESEFNNIFSKSASLSFIPTSAFKGMGGNVLSYLKLRAGYGEAPGFAGFAATRATLNSLSNVVIGPDGTSVNINSIDNFIGNRELKPELSREFEVGADADFFKKRLGFQFTYFKRDTEDQIVPVFSNPRETGGSAITTNLGNVRNEGIELGFNFTPIRTENFSWEVRGNYEILENTVTEAETPIYIGGYSNLGAYAIEGQPFGVLIGDRIQRDADGNFLVGDDGYWIATDGTEPLEEQVVGDPNADWKLNGTNTFIYKQLSLSFQLDYQHGGDIFARSANTLLARGLTTDTDFDRTLPIILPGVNNTTGEPNNVVIASTDAYFANIGFGPAEVNIYDATHIKLRDVTLTYAFSNKALEKTPFSTFNISLSGQNLFVRAFNTPKGINYDPELNSVGAGSNARGFDFLTSWNSRRYGMSVKVTF